MAQDNMLHRVPGSLATCVAAGALLSADTSTHIIPKFLYLFFSLQLIVLKRVRTRAVAILGFYRGP